MADILIKAGSFVAIIILGYVLRKVGFFKEEDFHVLAKIVLKITMPMAIVSNFAGAVVEPSLLTLSLLGLGGGILMIILAMILTIGKSGEERAFHILNMSGYNIGNFSMPFAQGFLGPVGVVATSLFDAGNAIICLGGSYSLASMSADGKKKISVMPMVKTLFKSIPFDIYLFMTVLSLLHLTIPSPVLSFAGIVGNANAFMAMLMVGVGFKLSGDKSQIGKIVKIILVRYVTAIILSLGFFYLLPFGLEYRQALAILVFSPIASAAPAFTAEMKGDFGLASAVNSVSIVVSIVLMTVTLLLVL
ncbi:MAG: AEC family transporter [Roseburia sp.]|nr:AEC family transporter [Roseburia sp.]